MTTLEKIRAEINNIKDFEVVNGALYVREYDVAQIIDKHAEQEPCDDAISRQAVLEIAKQHTLTNDYLAIQNLPSVRPQEQMGHWINKEFRKEEYVLMGKCSVCGRVRVIDEYCPNCGCRMAEPRES